MGKENKPDKEQKKEKKKKRSSDQNEGAELVKKCRIEVQPPADTELPVTACYFAAGPAPDGASYSLYQSGITTRPNYTLLGTKDKISFVGTTQGEQYAGTQASMCSQVVGVYNKVTGQLQLLPIAGGRVLRMEPRLPGLDYDRAGASDPSVVDEGPETREQLMAENKRLVAQFGSTRRRRQLNAREEGVVRAEKLGESGEALGMLMKGIAQKAAEEGFTKTQVAAQANASRHLPPHDLEATTPQAAYPLAQLLPPEIAFSLRITLLMKAANDDDAMQELSEKKSSNPYVLNRLSILRDQSDLDATKKRARLLAYLSVLMRLRMGRPTLLADGGDGTPGEGLANLARNIGTSPDILEPLLAKFYNASREDHTTRYARSKAGETLLQAYICVVALLAEPGAALAGQSVQEMADTLKISVSDLVQRFREVGAECKQVQVKHEDGSSTRMYNAVLMPDQNKTLRECLPAIKLMPQRAKK